MSSAKHRHQDFLFLDGLEPSHGERDTRSYLSRKVWKEKRLEQVRIFQKSSRAPPQTPPDPSQPSTESGAEPLEAQVKTRRPYSRDKQPAVTRTQLLPLETTRIVTDNRSAGKRHDSLITAVERDLINVDPFHTLPCKLNRSSQELAHFGTRLFLYSPPSWASFQLTRTVSIPITYRFRTSFSCMLVNTSSYFDSVMGRGVSTETLRWISASTSHLRRALSMPGAEDSDEALVGVLSVLCIDCVNDNGTNSHIHSKALARLFRLRGIQSIYQSHAIDLLLSFLLIAPIGKGQIAYLDHIASDAGGSAELHEWKADVDLLILELQNLSARDRAMHWQGQAERRALLIKVVSFLPHPLDTSAQDQLAFIICYLAVMLRAYRHRPRDCENLLRDLIHRCEELGPKLNLAEFTWFLVQGLDSDRYRKWHVIRMIKVLHRVSKGLQLKIGQFLHGLVDPRKGREVSLDTTDFESIRQEAFAGLPAIELAE